MSQQLFNTELANSTTKNKRTIAPPPPKEKLKMKFEDLPFLRSVFRFVVEAESHGYTVRNDSPGPEWFNWIHTEVSRIWTEYEARGISDSFTWTQLDVYRVIVTMKKNWGDGLAMQARVSVEKGHERCQKCRTSIGPMNADHIVPKSKGGPDHVDNRQLLCITCNPSKNNRRHY